MSAARCSRRRRRLGHAEGDLQTLPGYGGDVNKNREEGARADEEGRVRARQAPAVKLSTRNIPVYRDPSAILLDQLKEIWIDGELEPVETANWVPKLIRKDFTLGLNVLGTAVDEPDVYFYQNYVSTSKRNYPAFDDPEFDKTGRSAIAGTRPGEAQEAGTGGRLPAAAGSGPADHLPSARRDLLVAAAQGRDPDVNSQYNGWRMEDRWLDK